MQDIEPGRDSNHPQGYRRQFAGPSLLVLAYLTLGPVLGGLAVSPALAAEDGETPPEAAAEAAPAPGAARLQAKPLVLGDILVVGEKIERTVQETVASVGITTAQEIEDSNITDLNDVFARTANVNERFGGEGFAIRGINNAGVVPGDGEPLATLYIDNAPISGFGLRVGQSDVWDVEQVEVFRGPQSTSQGRNALAGAVVVRSKDPVFGEEAKMRAGLGDYGSRVLSGVINTEAIENQVAVRVALDRQESDGFVENPTLGLEDYARDTSTLARAKVLVEPDKISDLSLLLTTSFSRNHSGDDVVDASDPFARQVFSNVVGHEDADQYITSLEANYDLNDVWGLTSITTYNRTEYSRLDDDDQSAAGGQNRRLRENVNDAFTQELRLSLNASRLRGHLGVYFLDERADDDVRFETGVDPLLLGVPASLAPFYSNPFELASITDEVEDKTNYAVFGELEYDLTDKISVFGGLRYDVEEQERDGVRRIDPISPFPGTAGLPAPVAAGINAVNAVLASQAAPASLDSESDFNAFLPKIGATYHWTDDLSTSLSAQRGYRAGGAGNDFVTGLFTFDPEYVWNYEAALRSSWFDDRLTVNSNIFYMDWTDMQVQLRNPGNLTEFITTNAGSAELYGFELEVAARPMTGLDVGASAGYVETEFTEFVSPLGDFTGREFADAPNWTLSAFSTYRAENGLFAHVNANYQSSSFNEVDDTERLKNDGRILVNTRLGYEAEDFAFYVFSKNLFDEEYITSNVVRNNVVKVGAPRTVGAQLSLYW